MKILDPSGVSRREKISLNPLPASLAGLRLGYLDNTKWNLPALFGAIDGTLADRHGTVKVQYERKRGPSWAATESELGRFGDDIDLYLVGVGD